MEAASKTARHEISQGGEVIPETADELLAYWHRNSKGRLGMAREQFVAIVRTLIDNGRLTDPDRRKLVHAGFPELDT